MEDTNSETWHGDTERDRDSITYCCDAVVPDAEER